MSKLRVWWIPQVGIKEIFYVPVDSVEEGKKVMDLLAAYDAFQFQNDIKPDYCNVGGLQMFDEKENEWNDWYLETEDDYFENVDDYCKQCEKAEELEEFNQELFKQIDWEKIEWFPIIKEFPKECPWCHDIPIIAKDPLWNGSHGYHGCYEYYVACTNGKCKIRPKTKSYNDIYDMSENDCIEAAIKDWNDR